MGRGAALWPGLKQVAAEPEAALYLPPGKLGEHGAGGRLVAQGQLVLAQVGELQVQAIVVAGAEPVVVLAAVTGPR